MGLFQHYSILYNKLYITRPYCALYLIYAGYIPCSIAANFPVMYGEPVIQQHQTYCKQQHDNFAPYRLQAYNSAHQYHIYK